MSGTRKRISDIHIVDRCRKDLGDLAGLVESIADVGLLQPVVVTEDLRLIAGARRIAACQQLGWTDIEVTIARDITTATKYLHAERDENRYRLDLDVVEKVALGRKLEELEQPLAEQRKYDGQVRGGGDRRSAKALEDKVSSSGRRAQPDRTAHRVGAAIGMSRVTYLKARKIVIEAEKGNERAKQALAEMESTGTVSTPYARAFDEKKRPRGSNNDRLAKALKPLARYLKTYSAHNLGGISPKEARVLLALVEQIESGLFDLHPALEARTVVSRALK